MRTDLAERRRDIGHGQDACRKVECRPGKPTVIAGAVETLAGGCRERSDRRELWRAPEDPLGTDRTELDLLALEARQRPGLVPDTGGQRDLDKVREEGGARETGARRRGKP